MAVGIVTERLLPEILAEYQKAGKVSFGYLTIMREGISNFEQVASWEKPLLIPWRKIEDVRFVKGKFGIQVNGKWKHWKNGIS
ncbi:MAG TPA: hypothetical protein VGM01_05705 [Ktedonobacteraceae bacterium]